VSVDLGAAPCPRALNSVQIHAHRRPHCAFFAQSGGVPAR
jgi:hypothetical protein